MSTAVYCVDVGTELTKEYFDEYESFMSEAMRADTLKIICTATNADKLELVFFCAQGNVGKMAMARLDLMIKGFTVKWLEDAEDQGILDGVNKDKLANLMNHVAMNSATFA